jgi:hypothetical protein
VQQRAWGEYVPGQQKLFESGVEKAAWVVEIRKRCISQPTEHQAILLHHLGLRLPSSLEIREL